MVGGEGKSGVKGGGLEGRTGDVEGRGHEGGIGGGAIKHTYI